MDEARVLDLLGRTRYALLTTFRKDGRAVSTPVWLARSGDSLLVLTGAETGKVKRIRRSGDVLLAPCTARGKRLGADIAARAVVLPEDEVPHVRAAVDGKYGWQSKVVQLLEDVAARRRGRPHAPAGLAIRLP